jgi:hypothetical protein
MLTYLATVAVRAKIGRLDVRSERGLVSMGRATSDRSERLLATRLPGKTRVSEHVDGCLRPGGLAHDLEVGRVARNDTLLHHGLERRDPRKADRSSDAICSSLGLRPLRPCSRE